MGFLSFLKKDGIEAPHKPQAPDFMEEVPPPPSSESAGQPQDLLHEFPETSPAPSAGDIDPLPEPPSPQAFSDPFSTSHAQGLEKSQEEDQLPDFSQEEIAYAHKLEERAKQHDDRDSQAAARAEEETQDLTAPPEGHDPTEPATQVESQWQQPPEELPENIPTPLGDEFAQSEESLPAEAPATDPPMADAEETRSSGTVPTPPPPVEEAPAEPDASPVQSPEEPLLEPPAEPTGVLDYLPVLSYKQALQEAKRLKDAIKKGEGRLQALHEEMTEEKKEFEQFAEMLNGIQGELLLMDDQLMQR